MAGSGNIILLVFLFLAFYFLMLRPQRARTRAVQEVRANLRVGALVLTTAGMHARVAAVDDMDGTVLLEMAPGVTARYERAAVGRIVQTSPESLDGGTPTASDSGGAERGPHDELDFGGGSAPPPPPPA